MFLLTAATATANTAATQTFTTLHFILIAILIVLVVAAIIWGAIRKRARTEGERQEAARADQLLAHPQTETAVSPAPPPLGDSGMGGGVVLPETDTASRPKAAATRRAAPAERPVAKAPAAKPAPKAAAPKLAATDAPAARPTPAPKPVAAKPAAKAASSPATSYGLIDVKGLGPKAVPLLKTQGVGTLADLAGLSAARAAEIDAGLGVLSGRMARDKWVEQAKLLAAGKIAEFEATYGRL